MKTIKIVITQDDVDAFNYIHLENHPRAKNVPIKAPQHPSINEYTIMNNQAANRIKQNWKAFIVWKLEKEGLNNLFINKCRVLYKTYFKHSRRRDVDNLSPKYIFDGFVEGGFIVDDNYDHIISLTIEGAVDADNPRIEFVVEILE